LQNWEIAELGNFLHLPNHLEIKLKIRI